MKRRAMMCAWALALILILPGKALAQARQGPDALFQFIADRIETIVVDLFDGKLTAAQAAAEIEDLQFIAAAGQFAFDAEIRAAGSIVAPALAGLLGQLGSAAQALANNGTGDLQEAFLVRLGTAGQVSAALAAAFRGGLSNLSVPQRAALEGAAPGQAALVRAPDYRVPVAQDSIATVFSSRALSGSRATGMFDANLRLPGTLAGVTATVRGKLAQLLYGSANQVNLLVPMGIPVGTADVVVAGNNGAIATGTVQVVMAAPAIFTENATGSGPGAILNASTFRRGLFPVTTPENFGSDKRTRLAIFLTGIRNLPNTDRTNDLPLPGGVLVNVAESLRVTLGGTSVPVEYGGRHPQFTGLDQVNVVLPAELAGRGTVDLVVSSGSLVSNTVQVTIQ